MYLDPNPLVLVVHKAKYGQVPSLRVPIVAQFTQFGFNMLYLYLLYIYIFNYIHIISIHFISTVQGCPTKDLRAVKGAASVWMLSGLCTKQVEDFAFCHLDLAVGLDGLTMLTV